MILALFFWGAIIFICIIFLIISLSKVRINIIKLKISNNNEKIKKNILCKIEIYILGRIKINLGCLNNSKFKKIYEKSKKNYKKIKKRMSFSIKNITNLNPKIIMYKMNLKIGTPDSIVTSFIIVAISIVISYVFSNNIEMYDESKHKYIIEPIYSNRNSIDFELTSIVEFKIINIIIFLATIKYNTKNKKENKLKTKNKLSFES